LRIKKRSMRCYFCGLEEGRGFWLIPEIGVVCNRCHRKRYGQDDAREKNRGSKRKYLKPKKDHMFF